MNRPKRNRRTACYDSRQRARSRGSSYLFSQAVSKVRQPIESFSNWLNEKTEIQRASKVRATKGLLVHTFGKLAIALLTFVNF